MMQGRLAALFAALCLAAAPAAAYEVDENDPLEPMNRGTHWVNDQLDVYLLEPIAKGWEFVTPEQARLRLDKFFANLRFPVRFVGNLFQAKLRASGDEVGRFVVNSTVGLLGFFDPASHWGIGFHDEDFGQALGAWGTPPGPYLVLPIFGPSNPRDAVGLAVDTVLLLGPGLVSPTAGAAIGGTNLVNSRALALDDVREAKAAALDYYVLLRNGYLQLREAKIRDGSVEPEEPTDDLYDIDERFEDE